MWWDGGIKINEPYCTLLTLICVQAVTTKYRSKKFLQVSDMAQLQGEVGAGK